jgi:hypothetical protein
MLGKLLSTFYDSDLVTTTSSFTQDLRVILATRFSPPWTVAFQLSGGFTGF